MDKKLYLISYDLRNPDRNYEELYSGIKSFGYWWHQSGSVWMLVSDKSSTDVRNYLSQYIDKNDKLFVAQIINNWAGIGFKKEEYDWLHKFFKN